MTKNKNNIPQLNSINIKNKNLQDSNSKLQHKSGQITNRDTA